jgi:putative spermidine/putrescine transport system substrate-binding protein
MYREKATRFSSLCEKDRIVDKTLTRRDFNKLVSTALGVTLAGTFIGCGRSQEGGSKMSNAKFKDITLRHYGPSYSAISDIARQAEKDLGFKIEMQIETTSALINRAINRPDTIDIFDLDHWAYQWVIPKGVLQGIPVSKYKWWNETMPLFVKGTLPDGKPLSSQGTLPFTVQYLENLESKSFASGPTDNIAMAPHMMNADTLGVRPDLIKRPIKKWSELLNSELAGKVALVNIPDIGIMDAALAFESAGRIKYRNKGNMTREEIDRTIENLIKLKQSGHFHSFWSTFEASVDSFASGEVVLQSMWSPAIIEVSTRGIPVDYPSLEPGYRGWAAGLGIMRHVKGVKLEAAYEYLNWYNSGWVGAFIAKQGYYSSVPETAKKFLTDDEWGYWYEGKPADGPITGPHGKVAGKPGTTRVGGTFSNRMGNIACWNTVMRENDYLVTRWKEFIAA